MDYSWSYFMEDLSKIVTEQKAIEYQKEYRMLYHPLPEASIQLMRNVMKNRFRGYRESSGKFREVLNKLIGIHTKLCQESGEDIMLKRRHNALVYKYVVNTVAGNQAVAKKMGISKESLYGDLEEAIKDMLILCVGLPYLLQRKQISVQTLLKRTEDDYMLLKRCCELEDCLN